MEHPNYPGLEIDVDMRRQLREWRIQHVAWIVMYALLVGIMFGLIGGGPLSRTVAVSKNQSLQLEYEKFLRHRTSDSLLVSLKATSETVRVRLDSKFVQQVQIDTVTPQPERVIGDSDSLTFVFNTRPGARFQAKIEFRPAQVGGLQGWVAVDGEPRLAFSQFVYP